MNFVFESVLFSWLLLKQAAPFFLFGLLLAGLLKMVLSPEQVAKHLGAKGIGPIIKAAVIGIPLPLCSCSVLPVAASLKKQGAGKGPIAAFLVSTPESGIDSIAISWALLDPIMTFARPIAAFLSAAVAGLFQNIVSDPMPTAQATNLKGCSCSCSCSSRQSITTYRGTVTERVHNDDKKFARQLMEAVLEIWDDLSPWFFIGLMVAGVIAGLVPADFFSSHLGGGLSSMLLMLLIGIPIYICATASTPVAAAMILKGMSPGTALVFLMVGPATNATSMAVLLKILGRIGTAIYLASIAVCSIACGLTLDWLYSAWNIKPTAIIGKAAETIPESLMLVSALLLLGSFAYLRLKRLASIKKLNNSTAHQD